nr:acetyltransferase At1g77540 [Ipomoea batatas]GME01327.1 acetyltransferase At1g77540 [Ipomoea batatas]
MAAAIGGGNGGGGGGAPEAPKIIWNERSQRFETDDKKAYLEYELKHGGTTMDILHTYVPPSKRGLGLAALLSESAFSHAKAHSLSVIPSCSYISDTFLPRNPSWNSVLYKQDTKSNI